MEKINSKKIIQYYDILKIAEKCHEMNKLFCESINDFSQINWYDCPIWQKESAINGVLFHINNENTTPEDSHKNWMKEKISQGWIYGEQKNENEKTHPCLLPYNKLPIIQKTKDYIFYSIVKSNK